MATTQRQSYLYFCAAPQSALAGLLLQKKSRIAAERDPKKRAAFQEAIEQVDPKDLVFLDECGFFLALHLLYGWGPAKERLVEAVPSQRGKNLSVLCGASATVGALDAQGMVAITSKEGAIKRVDLETFLREDLLPPLLPGSVLVLDNARIHRVARGATDHQGGNIEKIVSEAGCSLLYLPPYSPFSGFFSHRTGLGLDQALGSSSVSAR